MKCLITRWRISAALNEGRTLSAAAERHLSGCAACSRYFAKARTVGETLGAGRGDGQPLPAHLHTRIMASLREARAEDTSTRVAWWGSARPAGITAAALLVLALGMMVLTNRHENSRDDVALMADTLPAVSVDGYRLIAADAIHEASASATVAMTAEMDRLKSDAASVGQHLWACIDYGHL